MTVRWLIYMVWMTLSGCFKGKSGSTRMRGDITTRIFEQEVNLKWDPASGDGQTVVVTQANTEGGGIPKDEGRRFEERSFNRNANLKWTPTSFGRQIAGRRRGKPREEKEHTNPPTFTTTHRSHERTSSPQPRSTEC